MFERVSQRILLSLSILPWKTNILGYCWLFNQYYQSNAQEGSKSSIEYYHVVQKVDHLVLLFF